MVHITGFVLPAMTPEELAHWNKALEWLDAALLTPRPNEGKERKA